MNEIQELKDRREQPILEKEALERELVPYATESPRILYTPCKFNA